MQLANTLVDKGLYLGVLRGNRKTHPPGSLHQVGTLARALIEGLSMVGVPLRNLFTFNRFSPRFLGRDGISPAKKEANQDTELYNRPDGQTISE